MKNYEARSYQKECLESLRQVRRGGADRALIAMASGLGKTVTAALDVREFLENFPNNRVLILCHQVDILDQIRRTFLDVFGEEYSYGMYNGKEKAEGTDFLFANLQSMQLHKEDFQPDDFAYIIVDEAHHGPARTYREAIVYFEPEFLLGMTATPERTDNADVTEIFGEIVFSYALEDAIYDGWLANIEYRMKVDEIQQMEYLLEAGERLSLKQLNREIFIPKRDEEIIEIIRKDTEKLDNPTMVIFCQSIAHADEIAEKIGAVVIHSQISTEEREQRLEDFRSGEVKSICAVDILNEGIDVPETDVVVFLRVTQSKIVFQQQLGRGLRRTEGKDKVLVLDFVATAERLELLFNIETEFKTAAKRYKKKGKQGEKEYFCLNINSTFFESHKVDIVKMIQEAKNYGRYTNEELLRKLWELSEELKKTPTVMDIRNRPDMPSAATYTYHFGSFKNALELAGCRMWTKKRVLEALKTFSEDIGGTPKVRDLKKNKNLPPSHVCDKYFGSFAKALKAAGIKLRADQRDWTDEDLLGALRTYAEELGREPRVRDVSRNPYIPSPTTYRNRFGSHNNALALAGFKK